jgi:hypothetical protein
MPSEHEALSVTKKKKKKEKRKTVPIRNVDFTVRIL